MTLVEIALPLLFSAILIVLRQKVSFTNYPNVTHYDSFSLEWPPAQLPSGLQLAYVPANSSVVRQVAEDVQLSLEQGFISAGKAISETQTHTHTHLDLTGIYWLLASGVSCDDILSKKFCNYIFVLVYIDI